MQSRRIDLEREISIRVPAFDSFVTEYSANVSTTGMFIRSDKPLPPDTQLAFEFKVADDWKLIRGKASVVWSRNRDEGPERPAGMGVLFTELDAQSRRLINWIIEKHVREGGKPFDLGELRGQYSETLAEMAELEDDAGLPPPVTRVFQQPKLQVERPPRRAQASKPKKPRVKEPVRFRLGSLILAGLAVTLLLGGLFWLSERSAQSAANPDLPAEGVDIAEAAAGSPAPTDGEPPQAGADPSVGDAAADPAIPETAVGADAEATSAAPDIETPAPAAAPTTSRPPAPPATAQPAPASPVFAEAARRLVTTWAGAWSDQDVEGYLSHYARDFKPTGGQSRSGWAANRRQRIEAPEFIKISISGFEAEVVSASRGRAVFNQVYESDTYQDSVRKVLELVREDNRWKILEEKAAG